MKKLLSAILIIFLLIFGWFYLSGGFGEENCVSPNSQLCQTTPDSPVVTEPIPPMAHELCPPDGPVRHKPIFSKTESTSDKPEVFQSFGNILNEQGELFSILVSGRDIEAIEQYKEEVIVCVDYLANDDTTTAEGINPNDMSSHLLQDVLALHKENLVIEIDLIGFLNEGRDVQGERKLLNIEGNLVRLGSINVEREQSARPVGNLSANFSGTWNGIFVSHRIDFIIDPTIGKNRWHDYRSKCLKSAKGKVSISNQFGSGKVTGNIYRSGFFLDAKSVSKGSSGTLRDSRTRASTYDFGVRGMASGNKYKIAGTWSRSHNSARPSGGGVRCR